MREMGSEFAHSYPKIAARLGIENEQCADPYVERLLEGFAFLAARVQLKIEEEFPKFCQQLLSMVYPDFLAPRPSMAVVHLAPNPNDSSTAEGFVLERGFSLIVFGRGFAFGSGGLFGGACLLQWSGALRKTGSLGSGGFF